MAMEFSGEYRIPARQQQVWDALNNPAVLQACIVGCSRLEKISDTEMVATVVAAVGPISATFKGNVVLSKLNAPHGYTLTGQGQGGAAGFAKMQAQVSLAEHPNGMQFSAFDAGGTLLRQAKYLSVGGGFVVTVGARNEQVLTAYQQVPYPFTSGDQLLAMCQQQGLSISQVMWVNERTWRTDADIRSQLLELWRVMRECVQRGLTHPGTLPGPFKVQRRAPVLAAQLRARAERVLSDPLSVLDWVNVYAFAVNEENAAGGRVVTAPTNGAAGVIPAVLHYYDKFVVSASDDGVVEFLMTAAAIGILYKLNASISGAEVGCQGEVGVACSMAAAGLAAVMGGSPAQVENAAEIGMEHNLGLTCDPIGGLVQVPCIERNAMGAVKALNAARMALQGDGQHVVSLDKVIKTMRETGADMKTKYKETSRGGLAVNIVEC